MDVKIQTPLGEMIGNQKEGYQEFLGIRYAQPPIRELRFQPPKLVEPWENIYDARKNGPIAPQPEDEIWAHFEMSEDCLLLNIITEN